MSADNKFLSEKNEPLLRIRCPVHGFIKFSENEKKLIDHSMFQRLRNIKQLALTCYVYPGALHSRFEHSLGVMEMVTRAFDSIYNNYGTILKDSFSTVAGFEKETIPKVKQLIRLAALLHDIGHTPFSHAGEILAPEEKHENISLYVIKEHLYKILQETYWDGIGDWIGKFIDNSQSEDFPPQFLILKQLISFELDFDRTDYLIRDSLYCGVDYGKFDYKRLLESLAIRQEEDRIEIAIDKGGWHIFEALILARYQMNTQVYYHRIRRIYDHYIRKYLGRIKKEFGNIDEILNNDDMTILHRIKNKKADDDNKMQKYANKIINRRHHKVIMEIGEHADANDVRRVKNIFHKIKLRYDSIDFIFDDARGNIHKLFIPEDQELEADLFVVEKKSDIKERLTEKSKIISKIPKHFRVLRIFADADDNKIKELKKEVQRLLKKDE